jgi:hypothetical protein
MLVLPYVSSPNIFKYQRIHLSPLHTHDMNAEILLHKCHFWVADTQTRISMSQVKYEKIVVVVVGFFVPEKTKLSSTIVINSKHFGR